ncbi:23S rRNA (uracil(1939)-C(5))-methyltransferase RlmD [Bradymonas sediminis]|uniref:23S rRNA (Uracil(1939)-C(5))-methyltransferase RlmD n=1 Tax=Bradymonas sediminis TaxID=1548548 RepID=A0A2Z4FJG9_9DELT|nr:23S rRNA (uracil(1939)-C(5))-methyltransferase RlmD [Bradymonas sediminis]AWV89000.1 23S rRNA (uracil(1939)-C(5))-methyltransferase RlmD [Bradymonas sediminis]TDP72014.1 23S rRNA m(5)U-1939 methyltransferase [Bradymonas sediminis]
MTIELNDSQRVTIDRLAHGGDGIGYLDDGRIVFVSGTLPGEVVDIEVFELKKSFARGRIEEVVEPAPQRVASQCPYSDECGGCQFWHTTYENELRLKTEAAWEAISRISKVEIPQARVLEAPAAIRYRSRVVFHQKRAHRDKRTGALEPNKIGFYRAQSKQLVDIDDCMITNSLLNQVRRALEPALRDVGDCDIILETASATSVMVTLVPETNYRTNLPRSLKAFMQSVDQNPMIRGIRVVGKNEDVIYGDIAVDADQILAHVPVHAARLGSGDFRQSNQAMNRVLVDEVTGHIKASGATSVLELYCGSGNFAFAMPESVEQIVGLEVSAAAVESADALARLAGLQRYTFAKANLDKGLVKTPWPGAEGFDLVLLDPPRTGATTVCQELADAEDGPSTIVYVSCDPACLGRDLKTLATGGWKVDSLTLLDMFSRTSHIESIAVLTR